MSEWLDGAGGVCFMGLVSWAGVYMLVAGRAGGDGEAIEAPGGAVADGERAGHEMGEGGQR